MHQYSYFEPEVLAGLNQERELSSVFDKLFVTLCGKHQTNLKKTPCMSTQSTPQISDFQKIKDKKYLDCV